MRLQQFHEAQRKVQRVSNENRSNATASRQEIIMSKNIQTSLATKLQEVSSGFRKKQAQYLQSGCQREGYEGARVGMPMNRGLVVGGKEKGYERIQKDR